jgi:hypothetical protein
MKPKGWSKRTGYKMSDRDTRQIGYRGVQYDPHCFQSQLKQIKDDGREKKTLQNAKVIQIPFDIAQDFILQYEWLGTMGTTKFSYGLYDDGELVAVACFGTTAGTGALSEPFGAEYKDKGIVLVRGASASFAHQHSSSYLIGQCRKLLKKRGIWFAIAYSDPSAGEIGTIYQATNWKFYGWTSPVTYLVRPDGKRVDPKIIHKYAKKNGITSADQKQRFVDEGYTFEKGNPKMKYLLFTDQEKILMKSKRVEFYPYLKRTDRMDLLYEEWCKERNGKSSINTLDNLKGEGKIDEQE